MKLRKMLRMACIVFFLSGCGSAVPPEPRTFDLGLEAPAARLPAVRIGSVRAIPPFDAAEMQYRLAYRNAAEVSAFATSRWAATPADMFRRQLLRAAHEEPAKCALDIEIQEFSQIFSAQEISDVRIDLRAVLRGGPARSWSVVEPNGGADAVSGAAAFTRAANRAIGEIGGAFALTPSVAVGAPSRNYDYQGEAVVGRNLEEVALALDVGQRLDFISPLLSVQGRYAYAFVERVLDIPNNRSNFSVEASYLLTPHLAVRGLAYWQWTHGGLRAGGPTLPDLPPPGEINTPERGEQHDRLLRNNYFHAGAGIVYQFPHFEVYASYIGFGNGTDTHKGAAYSVGISWPFDLGGGARP
jgi:cholesterol transport system auxiliary component